MENAEFNTKLLEIKLLEIAIRASGASSQASASFVKELGITEIVEKIKDEHPELAPMLMEGPHSAEWTEGYEQACGLVAVLGELAETMLDQFGEGDSPTDSEFTIGDWTRELTATARRLVPEVSNTDPALVKDNADA